MCRLVCVTLYSLVAGLLFTGCVKNPYEGPKELDPAETFDFVTSTDITLSVNYDFPQGYDALFSVYTQYPMTTQDGYTALNPDLSPVFKAMTVGGSFSGQGLVLPTYVETIYIYCAGVDAPLLLSAPVSGTSISVDARTAQVAVSRAGVAQTRADGYDYNGVPAGFKTLGNWNINGIPDYLDLPAYSLTGPFLSLVDANLPDGRVNVQLLDDRYETNLHIKETAGVELVFVSGKAGYNNSLGYFTYPTGQKPTSPGQITDRTIVFPSLTEKGTLPRGSRVTLKYWNPATEQFEEDFPAGTSIGFFIITNGYGKSGNPTPDGSGAVNSGERIFYSIPELNTSEPVGQKQHSVLLKDPGNDRFIIGFEDLWASHWYYNQDKDFNDAIVFVTSDPRTAIDDNDVVETEDPEPTLYEFDYLGTLSFEDMWPTYGDYDMNDNMIEYASTYYMNSSNQATKIVNRFTLKASTFSGRYSGFGFQMGITPAQVKSLSIVSDALESDLSTFSFDAKGLEANQSKAVVIVCQNIQGILNRYGVKNKTPNDQTDYAPNGYPVFTVTTEFTAPLPITRDIIAPYNPFAVIMSGGISGQPSAPRQRGIEVHLPNYEPTDLADRSLFGTADDRSRPEAGLYYVSEAKFPWGIQLPVDFPIPYEKVRIDVQYPDFAGWANSQGTLQKDWYLHPRQ